MTQSTADTNDTDARPPLPTPKERRRLREAKDLTEAQVATAVGVTRATVRSWETGRTTPRGRKGEHYARLLAAIEAEMTAVAEQDDPDLDDDGSESCSGAGPDPHDGPNDSSGSGSGEQDAARPATAARAQPAKGAKQPAKPHAANTRPKPAAKKAAKPPATPHTRHEHPAPAPAPAASVPVPAKEVLKPGAPTGDAGTDTDPDAGTTPKAPDPHPGQRAVPGPLTAAEAFDALYCAIAPDLARQAYLLTGRTRLSRESVERAFHLAWENWPAVATDRDPAGWVRTAAYEYAMAPWHRFRRAHKHPDQPPAEPERRALLDALLDLPPAYRRTVLLYDGLGLDLPETAAETEASTPAAASRLLHARDAIARRVPEAAGATSPEALSSVLRERIADLASAGPACVTALPSAPVVRTGSERRRRFWTRAAIAFTTLIVGATMFTMVTVPHYHVLPVPPGERVSGVPVNSGPQRLTSEDVELRDKLRKEPARGPYRLVVDIR